jgi:NAD(P)-dependent dehydrogenase (short-subunit alcohol dehydrogenase family)
MKFMNKTIFVAGGTGALGHAVTSAFIEQGANVVVSYRNPKEFAGLKPSPNLEGLQIDVTDQQVVETAVRQILAKHGQIDALVNAVGGYVGGVKFWEADSAVLDQMLSLNLRSGHALCRTIVPVMLKQGYGSIVNVAAKAAVEHPAGAAAYAASKAAAVAMMDSLAADLRGTEVRVNSVLPSIIDSEANRKAMPTANHAKWPKPEEIARVILFLCSPDAKLIHGASIPV